MTDVMTRDLLTAYGNHRTPAWAYPLRATIPFVGLNYGRQGARLLVYASAENVLTAIRDEAPWLDEGSPHAGNRHDFAWREGWGSIAPQTRLGIAPFEDGVLREAARRLLRWEGGRPSDDNVELTEQVAVANLSKFAYSPERSNTDVKRAADLRASIEHVQADLAILDPTVVLVAKTLPLTVAAEVARAARFLHTLVVWMPQAHQRSHRHVRKHLSVLGAESSQPPGEEWEAAWLRLLRLRYVAAIACRAEPR